VSDEDRRKLGELLIRRGRLQPDQLERALRLQNDIDERIGVILVQRGDVAERDVAEALSEQSGIPVATAADYKMATSLNGQISIEFMQRSGCIPLASTPEAVVVAVADPNDEFVSEAIRLATGRPVTRRIGTPSDISATLQRIYGGRTAIGELVDSAERVRPLDDEADVAALREHAGQAPIVRVVDHIIAQALEARASDIHIEPFNRIVQLRLRIDGVLRAMEAPPSHSAAAIISRIKVLANLDIAERRLPQDGRLRLRIDGRDIDIRVSSVPTLFGESVVMRILDKGQAAHEFDALGFSAELAPTVEALVRRPHGIMLCAGPTGSGKSTTLYAALQLVNEEGKKLLTVEDPVEYQLDGVNQIQIKPQIGLSFSSALRSILRQDPDIIMIGEMRDLETASIAVQAALTGHKVFSTVHTNDAASTVTRLVDMGVELHLLTSTLQAVLAQRLVRVLCQHCKRPYRPGPETLSVITRYDPNAKGIELHEAVGCERCDHIGYRGRTSILELLVLDDELRKCVVSGGDALVLRQAAVARGMVTLHQDGIEKARQGVTTIEEVLRVTAE
jgi:general secretion pathway protein E